MELTVYSAPWCRDCHTAKRWLAEHKISYKEINIDEVPGAAQEVIRQTGKRAIPQFVLNGRWIQPYVPGRGFKYAEMAELFGINASTQQSAVSIHPPSHIASE
jgi:mycoredoxin